MSEVAQQGETQGTVAEFPRELVARFVQMATLVPSEDGSGMERIIEQLLNAESWEDLSDPWESTNAEKLRGKRLRIDSLTRRPSQYPGGLGVFLVVKGVDLGTGEAIVWTTSAQAVIAQLVRAYAKGWLPCVAEMIIADRPTEAGYYPHHLRFLAVDPRG